LNPFSYEAELLAIAVLLYLYDSSVLLFSNEALLTSSAEARWTAVWGWTGFVLVGKSLCVLNPLTPHVPAFRLSWQFERKDVADADRSWTDGARLLRRLRATTLGCAIGLFLFLPLGLFTSLGTYALIAAAAAVYGSTIVGLLRLLGVRDRLGLSGWRFTGFAFECIVCPPFSANMARRIALAQRVEEALPDAAYRLVDPDSWRRLRAYCESRIDEEIDSSTENSPRRANLETRKRQLESMSVAR
jgi:hypothetical protein